MEIRVKIRIEYLFFMMQYNIGKNMEHGSGHRCENCVHLGDTSDRGLKVEIIRYTIFVSIFISIESGNPNECRPIM